MYRLSLKTLKDFGFGKKSIEDSIHYEIEELAEQWMQALDTAPRTLN